MAETHIERSSIAAGGSLAEAVAGIGAVILAILGLTRILPEYMASIGTIVVGGALFLEGVAANVILGDWSTTDTSQNIAVTRGGIGAEVVGGAAGVALGVLSLVDVAPMTLMPVAVIVYGAALLLGAAEDAALHSTLDLKTEPLLPDRTPIARASFGSQVLIGLAVIVLGILALLQESTLILTLIALLSVGAGILLNGTTVSARLMSKVR